MTLVYINPFLSTRYGEQDIFEVCLSMEGYQHDHIGFFYSPPQEDLVSGLCSVSYVYLFQREYLFTMWGILTIKGEEELV